MTNIVEANRVLFVGDMIQELRLAFLLLRPEDQSWKDRIRLDWIGLD